MGRQRWFGQSLDNKPFIAVGPDEHVFITDPEGYRVIEFTSDGQFVRTWGDFGKRAPGDRSRRRGHDRPAGFCLGDGRGQQPHIEIRTTVKRDLKTGRPGGFRASFQERQKTVTLRAVVYFMKR
jgi:hypothetical protein